MILMLSDYESFNCLQKTKSYTDEDTWNRCFQNFISKDPRYKLVYFAAMAIKAQNETKEYGTKMGPYPGEEKKYNKEHLELLCRHSDNEELCKQYFTKNYFGLNFLNMLSENDLKCIRESASETEMDKKCKFTLPRYLIKLPGLYPEYFKNKNYEALATNLLDSLCILDSMSNQECNKMIEYIRKDPFLMGELEMRINPDVQKYCYINDIKKPENCISKYINENREFKRMLISKITRKMERLIAESLLNSSNEFYNKLSSTEKEQVLKTAKLVIKMQDKFGGYKSLFEQNANEYQENLENFQNQTADNQAPYLMTLLLKIPEVKEKFIESKAKLLIHNAIEKENIVTLLSYPKFEECLSNYEFSKCKTKHIEEAKVFKSINNQSANTLPTPPDSAESRPLSEAETSEIEERNAINQINQLANSGELDAPVLSSQEQEELQAIIDGNIGEYNPVLSENSESETTPQSGLGDEQNLGTPPGQDTFVNYTLGVDADFEIKSQDNKWISHNPTNRLRNTCKKAKELNLLEKNDVGHCVSYINAQPELRTILLSVLENNEAYECVYNSSDPDTLNNCLFRFFVDYPTILNDVKHIIESRVNKAYAKVALKNILESFTNEEEEKKSKEKLNPVVGLAQPPYAAGFHDPNDPYDLNNPVKLERPIHKKEFPTKLDWPPQRYTISQRSKRNLQDITAHNDKPTHSFFEPLKAKQNKSKQNKSN